MKSGLLLSGKPIKTSNGINIYPLTLGEIMELGMANYSYFISFLTLKDEMLKALFQVQDDMLEEMKQDKLQLLISIILADESMGIKLLYFISALTKQRVLIEDDTIVIVEEIEEDEQKKEIKRPITNEVYEEIIDILDLQNCSKTVEEVEEYEDDPEIRAFIEKKNRLNKIIEEASNKDGDITLEDLVSSLAVANAGLNILNIWDLTLYQFYNQLKRYNAKVNADMAIRSMLAGASDVELKDWMGKLSDNK